MLENTEVLGQILDICHQKRSGTLFLTSAENKMCHIVFEQGKIIAMDYDQLRGEAVAEQLPRLKILHHDFNSAMTRPWSSKARLDPQADVFAKMGFRRIGEAAESSLMPSTTSQRMYRGHLIDQPVPAQVTRQQQPTAAKTPAAEKPKKSKRIYRGQVIED